MKIKSKTSLYLLVFFLTEQLTFMYNFSDKFSHWILLDHVFNLQQLLIIF